MAATPERIERRIGTAAGSAEVRMDALAALDRLPERQRVAVMLRYMEDLPYGISRATGWPENTCKTLVRRGIQRLGAMLSDEPNGKEAVR